MTAFAAADLCNELRHDVALDLARLYRRNPIEVNVTSTSQEVHFVEEPSIQTETLMFRDVFEC